MWQKMNEALLIELTENATLRKLGIVFFPQEIDTQNRTLQIVQEAHVSPDGFSPVYGEKMGNINAALSFDQLLNDGWEVAQTPALHQCLKGLGRYCSDAGFSHHISCARRTAR